MTKKTDVTYAEAMHPGSTDRPAGPLRRLIAEESMPVPAAPSIFWTVGKGKANADPNF